MIVLVDTSVFCNIINLPGFSQDRASVLDSFERYNAQGATFLLPLVVFFEAGNHVGHLPNGNHRRIWAEKLAESAKQAISGNAPWTATPMPTQDTFLHIVSRFSSRAVEGLGLGDHSIVCLYSDLRSQFPKRRILIWSLDRKLAAHGDAH